MDLTMFKYHDECGRIGFTEDMYEKKDEIYNEFDNIENKLIEFLNIDWMFY